MKGRVFSLVTGLLFILLIGVMIFSCGYKPGIPGVDLYFESSWESASGKSDLAVMDNGLWDSRETTGGIQYVEVISELKAPGGNMIYPVDGDNMLSIGANGDYYENIEMNNYIRMEDEHTYLRFYMLVLKPDLPKGGLHGIQDLSCSLDGAGSVNFWVYHISIGLDPHNPLVEEDNWYVGFAFRDYFNAILPVPDYSVNDYFGNGHYMWPDSWEAEVRMWPEESDYQDEALDFYRWYRFETHVHWLAEKNSSTPALYYMRIYDDDNNLVIDENNIYSDAYDGQWQPVVKSLKELYSVDNDAEGRRLYINALHDCLMLGTNGFDSGDEPRLYLVDDLAMSSKGWIGE